MKSPAVSAVCFDVFGTLIGYAGRRINPYRRLSADQAVIPPFLALARNRGQAARANFCLGVMPPRAIFGLS